MHDASKKCPFILYASRMKEHFLEASNIQWGLRKHGNYINESDVIILICLIGNVNRRRERSVHSFYGYALLPLNICHIRRVQNEWTYFRSVESIREYLGRVEYTFNAPCTFWMRRRNMLLCFNVISDASCKFSTCRKWHLLPPPE